ncbi:hypothetical protein LEMLEM_LOCUS7178 [Lemmus lemmus]
MHRNIMVHLQKRRKEGRKKKERQKERERKKEGLSYHLSSV